MIQATYESCTKFFLNYLYEKGRLSLRACLTAMLEAGVQGR
jgi:hypothetical protein